MPKFNLSFMGGIALSWFYSLSVGEIYKTIFLAAIGALVSFFVSYYLKKMFKK